MSTAPPEKNQFMVKMCTPPLKINILQFCAATAPLSLELPDGCRQGWGWGCRGRGRGRQNWVGEEGECGNS